MRLVRRLVWLPLLISAGPAHAHAPIPGIKGFYVGFLHPFSTPSQALLMLSLGLLAGSFVVGRAQLFLGAFLIFSLLGLFVGSVSLELDIAMFSVTVATCTFAALAPGKSVKLAIAFIAISGLLIGSVSIPDDGQMKDRIITMAGSIVGANLGLLYLFGFCFYIRERFKKSWVGIGFRIASAWLAAIALLMLALRLSANGAL